MKNPIRALLVVAVLVSAALACNFPNRADQIGQATQLPAPNQTLTALFAITLPAVPATPTQPPVITATSSGSSNEPAPAPTDTEAPPAPTTAPPKPPAPTATRAQPKPTATIPFARSRAAVVARYLSTPPTLDGDWSEWKNSTTEYPANNVVWGAGNWTNNDDLSSSFHVGWDNQYLYIAVKVRDDQYVQNASGDNLYKGDSLELLFDANLRDDFYYSRLSPDDFQLGIAPGRPDPEGTSEAYLWFPSNIAGSRGNVKIGSRLENGLYRVEAAIPWSIFETTPANGKHYGFALSINDNDDPSQNIQQSMVSNVAGRKLTDPTTWGDLQLVK